MDAESAFLYLAGEMRSRAADVTAAHLVECAHCRELVEEVSGIIGSSRELLQLAHHGGLDTEPPSPDVLMARGTAILHTRRAETGSGGGRPSLLKPTSARMAGTIAATLCLAVGLAGLLWWTRSDLSAAELLREAKAAQASARPAPDSAVRRVLELEERRYSDGRLLTRQTVEIWDSPATRRKARRLYTDGNVLLAGEWARPSAPNLVAGRGLHPQVQSGPPAPAAADVWRWEPSVAHFELLARDLPTLEAEKTPHEYVITASGESSSGPALVRLILTRPGLRPVEQRIVFKRGDALDDLVEYRIIESDSRTVPLASMAAGVFEPNPELLPAAARSDRPGRAAVPTAAAGPALGDAEADALELEITYRLHRLENCVRGEPTINRGPRRIGVSVAVETDACLLDARRHFESLESRRKIELTLVQQRSAPEGPRPGNEHAPVVLGTAVHTVFASHLRDAIGSDRSDAEIADAATGLSQWIVDRSGHALGEARAMESLITTWDVPRLWSLDVDSRAKWQGILRDHARSLGSDAESLRVQMERTLVRPAPETAFDAVISDLADVPRATVELTRLAEAQHRLVVQLLSPADAVPNAAELMRELVTTLSTLARGAEQFLEPWSLTAR